LFFDSKKQYNVMKISKLMLSAVVVLGIVTTATAFKPKAFFPADLWYITTASGNPCVQSTNATDAPLAPNDPPTHEGNFDDGYFTDGPGAITVNGCSNRVVNPKAATLD
jgi:hypothetical protein